MSSSYEREIRRLAIIIPAPIIPATPSRPATVNVPATAPVFEKNPELEEGVLEGVDEAVVPVAKLVNVPVYADVSPNGCAAGVVAMTAGATDVGVDAGGLTEEGD
jgi:hypothetical protein